MKYSMNSDWKRLNDWLGTHMMRLTASCVDYHKYDNRQLHAMVKFTLCQEACNLTGLTLNDKYFGRHNQTDLFVFLKVSGLFCFLKKQKNAQLYYYN